MDVDDKKPEVKKKQSVKKPTEPSQSNKSDEVVVKFWLDVYKKYNL